tara:strand:+ start:187 stop:315 length:129 start_codon:yes stop_codon:yes gene_type:complete
LKENSKLSLKEQRKLEKIQIFNKYILDKKKEIIDNKFRIIFN